MNNRFSRWMVVLGLGVGAACPAWGQSLAPEPLTLQRAAELALERAPQLAAVRAAREGGEASADLARDAFHPSAWLTTTPGYTYGLPGQIGRASCRERV